MRNNKRIATGISFLILFFVSGALILGQSNLDNYLENFGYADRKEMKVSSEQIVKLLESGNVILLDIRFREEQQSWAMPFATMMPLHQLPERYTALDKSKTIVTACPHPDRAIMAIMYLKSKGYNAKYLNEGLLGLADYLRGDRAREFIEK